MKYRGLKRILLIFAVLLLIPMSQVTAAAETKSAEEITREQFVVAVDAVARYARVNNYKYGDSRSEIPIVDKLISCDRLIARALWDLGFRDQQIGGITVGSMPAYLRAHGFIESTNPSDIGYGSIVLVRVGSVSYWSHTFVTIAYDPATRRSDKYDCGTQGRINTVQPFKNEPWYYQDAVLVYNIPDAVHVTAVSLDPDDAIMLPGQSFRISATVTPESARNRELTWSSSDSGVATVSSTGVVNTIAPGHTVLTATSADSGISASCKLEVLAIPVTKISLNASSKTISRNHSVKLRATIKPKDATDPTVCWSSSRPKVAYVSQDGTVTGLKAGTAKITAKAGNRTAVCRVTVKYVPVRSVSMRKKLNIKVGRSYRLKLKFSPSNVSNTRAKWKSSNRRIVQVDSNGRITALRKGTARITVTTNSQKKKAVCVVTVK